MIETCLECKHSRWLVGQGQGFRCASPDNKWVKLSDASTKREMPVIPNRKFVCDHFSVKHSKKALEKLIFRLYDHLLDGKEIDEELLTHYKKLLDEVRSEQKKKPFKGDKDGN